MLSGSDEDDTDNRSSSALVTPPSDDVDETDVAGAGDDADADDVDASSSCFMTSMIQLKRSFIMPLNISGEVEMYLLMLMISSCMSTAK